MDTMLFILMIIGAVVAPIAIPLIVLYCIWPGLRTTSFFSGRGAGLMRTRDAMLWLFTKPAIPVLKIWKFPNWLTSKDPKDLAPILIWFVVAALLFKPLFGNPFSRDGWENAFDEPAGFIVYITIALVTLILITSGIRRGFFVLSDAWKRTYWRSLICLLVVGGVAYFLYFAIDDYLKKRPTESVIAATAQTTALTSLPASQKTPSSPDLSEATSLKVSLNGTEKYGVRVFDLAPGEKAIVKEVSRNHCSLDEEKLKRCTSLWGYKDSRYANYWNGRWRPNHRYSGTEGVMAGETLVILGEVGNEKSIIQFPDGKTHIEIENNTQKTLALTLYFHGLEEYWEDSSQHAFVSKDDALRYGYNDVRHRNGFDPQYQEGSAVFTANKIS